jgi:hypothetical protein
MVLASAASIFLQRRKRMGEMFGRQIVFWLIFLSVATAITAENGWPRRLVVLLFINAGIGIFSLWISRRARRSVKQFGSMSPEQREQALSKMPPFVRDRIVRDLKDDAV